MNGHLVPPEILMIEPWWKNFFCNMATVQFDHRLGAWMLAAARPARLVEACCARTCRRAPASSRTRRSPRSRCRCALGIATLLAVVPLHLAAAHQAGAVLLFGLALALAHAMRPRATAA